LLLVLMWPSKLSRERVEFGVGGRGGIIGGISLTRRQLGARVDDDDTLQSVPRGHGDPEGERDRSRCNCGTVGSGDRFLSNEGEMNDWVKKLTSSSSRSMAESAFMMEPLSDSMEEDIFPASRRSAGLTKNKGREGER